MTYRNSFSSTKRRLRSDELGAYSLPKKKLRVSTPNMTFSFIKNLQGEKNPGVWEEFVPKVLPILDDLEPICKRLSTSARLPQEVKTSASHWVQLVSDIRDKASRVNQTIIGVLGNSGNGKSSLINALLDERSLLPTHCMRACTACAIEISYNHDASMENPYRAEVEFISREEWVEEVEKVLKHLANDDDAGPDSEVAEYIAKVKAVYPGMEFEDLARCTSAQLAQHPSVSSVLGTRKSILGSSGEMLRDLLRPYVDSNDKGMPVTMALWPLVKIARIYTKAEVLRNGVIIVDLPGYQDCDAAKDSVATGYMKACSGIWIVSEIKRAVDNKTATGLMGNAVKRQLRLDDSFSALTFICSKTDDMSVESAFTNLKSELESTAIEAWEELKELGPKIASLKPVVGKLPSQSPEVKKTNGKSHTEHSGIQTASTSGIAKSQEMKARNLEDLKSLQLQLIDRVRFSCIQKRNEISRRALKQYFAQILRESDQQAGGPQIQSLAEVTGRNYEEASDRLPVFCTSSLVYQSMKGLSTGDQTSELGFRDIDDTEIPQLQRHAQKLTEKLRIAKQSEVLAGICQLLNSLAIWAQNAPDASTGIDGEVLSVLLAHLENNLCGVMDQCSNSIALDAQTAANRTDASFESRVTSVAGTTASSWAAPRKEGGLHWQTLRALLQRDGIHKGRDLNEELTIPLKDHIADQWESFLLVNLPQRLNAFLVSMCGLLSQFHESIIQKLDQEDWEDAEAAAQLLQQLSLHQMDIMRLVEECRAILNAAQKDANRCLTPFIKRHMIRIYQECSTIRGTGMTKTIRSLITRYVGEHEHEMFWGAVQEFHGILENALTSIQEKQLNKINIIIASMRSDYMMALMLRENSARKVEAKFKVSMVKILEKAQRLGQ